MQINLATSEKVGQLHYYVDLVLDALGHPEALVTDESRLSDFLIGYLFSCKSEDDSRLKDLQEYLAIEINHDDYIWKIAERYKNAHKTSICLQG